MIFVQFSALADKVLGDYWETAIVGSLVLGFVLWLVDRWREGRMELITWRQRLALLEREVEASHAFISSLRREQSRDAADRSQRALTARTFADWSDWV